MLDLLAEKSREVERLRGDVMTAIEDFRRAHAGGEGVAPPSPEPKPD